MQVRQGVQHTYGATPATVGMIPRYSAAMPPSDLYMAAITVHMPGSLSLGTSPSAAKEAVWMESRVLTMSSGYVKTTDVIPAIPPQTSLSRGAMTVPGSLSKNCCNSVSNCSA